MPGKRATIAGIKTEVKEARILSTGERLEFIQKEGKLVITGLPAKAPDKYDTVIALKLKGRPEAFNYSGKPLP